MLPTFYPPTDAPHDAAKWDLAATSKCACPGLAVGHEFMDVVLARCELSLMFYCRDVHSTHANKELSSSTDW